MRAFSVEEIDESRFPEFPWESLVPSREPRGLIAQARHFWSENAFNEYASSLAMAQMAEALAQAGVPPELSARDFAAEERIHTALCSGVARRCGGGVEIPYDPASLYAHVEGTPLERATELVVRICCLGEAVSLPLLTGNLRAARQPLARAVLERIVRDETRHCRFGWQYLEWVSLADEEKRKLGRMIGTALRQLAPMLNGEGGTADGGGLGWMSPTQWRELAKQSVENALLRPLGRHGIQPL